MGEGGVGWAERGGGERKIFEITMKIKKNGHLK